MLWLAVRDGIDEWPTSLCLAVGVVAAAVPLLLLLSIRSGVISQMRGELERFPSSRELTSTGQPVVTWQTVSALRSRKDVAFAAPLTRMLSATAVLRSERTGIASEVDLAPSGAGDPLGAGATPGALAVSEPVARELRLRRGDRIRLIVNRTAPSGEKQASAVTLRVARILDAPLSGRRLGLIPADLLVATEIYREDAGTPDLVSALTAASKTRASRNYAGVRLYARSIDDVERVRSALLKAGIETRGRIEEIRLIRRLDRGLAIFIAVIGSIGVVGLCLSLAAAQWAWVERKRMDLSYLRLIGLEGRDVALLPIFQSLLIVFVGMSLAALFAWIADAAVDRLFAGQLMAVSEVSRLGLAELGIVAGLAALAAIAASAMAALAVRRISPAEALRGS